MSVISSERVPFIRSNFSCKIFANSSKKIKFNFVNILKDVGHIKVYLVNI